MFQSILIPTDLTPRDSKALEVASTLCAEGNFKVDIVHVIETINNADGDEFQPFYDRLEQRAAEKMLEIIGRMELGKGNIHTHILFGKRVREIVKFADENRVDLIVLSSHKIDRAAPAEGWATISYRVAILAHCPVLMVK